MKKYFLTIAALLSFLCGAILNVNAQSEKKSALPFPVLPFIVEYEYAPYYFSQDIYGDSRYSLIEVIFVPNEPVSLQIVLTDKESKKRTFYCNSEAKAKALSLEGKEAVAAKIDFKATEEANVLPIYNFAFQDKGGQLILWRVIPTSRPSTLGSGLTPMAKAEGLRLEYRDIATHIGEGTIVKIGEKIYEAEPWAEISSPPYFYAYHGSFTAGRHIGAFVPGSEKWKITSTPNELKKDAEWIMTDERGRRRVFRITAANKDEITVAEASEQETNAASIGFVIRYTPQGFAMRSLQMNSRGQHMQIAFAPELPLYTVISGKIESAFTVSQGKADKIAGGAITAERSEDTLRFSLTPKSPDWAKLHALESIIKIAPNRYQIETRQAAK